MKRCSNCKQQRQLKDGLCDACRGTARNPEQQQHAEQQGQPRQSHQPHGKKKKK